MHFKTYIEIETCIVIEKMDVSNACFNYNVGFCQKLYFYIQIRTY